MDTTDSEKSETTITSSTEMSFAAVEEFQSIGLRPMEFRPEVIRRAMNRSALPLATLHLDHPGGVVERRLSHVATTGYRLLDPRRREDTVQRMMLGRIHPQLTDEVVREMQAKGQALMAPDTIDELDIEVESDLLKGRSNVTDQPKRALRGLFLASDTASSWSQSLQSPDLLVDRPVRRILQGSLNWAAKRALTIAASVGFIAITVGAWSGFKNTKTPVIAQVSSEGVDKFSKEATFRYQPKVLANESNAPGHIVNPVLADSEPAIEPLLPQAELADTIQPTDREPEIVESTFAVVSPQIEPAVVDVPQPSSPGTMLELAALERSDSTEPSNRPKAQVESAKLQPNGVAIVRIDANTSSRPEVLVPSDGQLVEAYQELEQALSKVAASDWSGKLKASLAVAESAKIADQNFKLFAALRESAMYAILSGDHSTADTSMLAIVERFDTDLNSLAVSLSAEVVRKARLDLEKREVVTWLGNYTGRSLVAGKLDSAEYFASLLQEIAEKQGDDVALQRSEEFAKELVSFRRFESTAVAIDSQVESKVSDSDHYGAGRYWALVRRDWVKALPHLSAGSDARLAALASGELLMGGKPDFEDSIELAAGYFAMAEKSKGWLADSYALHADELLRLQSATGSSTKDLELQRLRSEISEQFSVAFSLAKRMQLPSKLPAAESAEQQLETSSHATFSQMDANASVPLLVGRLFLHGQDIGTDVRYEPGVVLNDSVYDQIEERTKLSLSDASMELSGIIHAERPTAILIQVTTSSIADEQTVMIDGKPLVGMETSNSSVNHYRADLATGTWTLRWNVSKLVDGLSLQIVDGLSGSPVPLVRTSENEQGDDLALPQHQQITIASQR